MDAFLFFFNFSSLSAEISVQLLQFVIFGCAAERHWCLNLFPLINLFFFHAEYEEGTAFNLAALCMHMTQYSCGIDIFAEFGSCVRRELQKAQAQVFYLAFSPVITYWRGLNFYEFPSCWADAAGAGAGGLCLKAGTLVHGHSQHSRAWVPSECSCMTPPNRLV